MAGTIFNHYSHCSLLLVGTHQGPLHTLLPSFQSILLKHQFVLGAEARNLLHVASALVALTPISGGF